MKQRRTADSRHNFFSYFSFVFFEHFILPRFICSFVRLIHFILSVQRLSTWSGCCLVSSFIQIEDKQSLQKLVLQQLLSIPAFRQTRRQNEDVTSIVSESLQGFLTRLPADSAAPEPGWRPFLHS